MWGLSIAGYDCDIDDCYDDKGKVINKEYVKMASAKNCKYCEFKDKSDLCDRNKK